MTTRRFRIWIGVLALLLLIVLVTSILILPRAKQARREDTKDTWSSRESVTLRLNWIPDPTFAGAFMAQARKTWGDSLNVEIRNGGMNLDPVRLVSDGTDDFGIVGADRVLYACAEDRNIVAVALELRRNPVAWVVHDTSSIRGFHDLRGRKVGQKFGSETEAVWRAVSAAAGLGASDVQLVPVQFSAEPFINGQVDAFPVYVNEEPNTLRARGVAVRVLHPSEIGVNMYGNVLITTRQTIQRDSAKVQHFVNGLLRGWELAAGPRDEVARELVAIEPDMGNVPTAAVLEATVALARGSQTDEQRFGWMEESRWQASKDLLTRYAELPAGVSLDRCYTNKFVAAYYRR
jgi:ABC-type nitrate/sulfonate/bicarbonate transport system substrate-binding protein